MCAFKVSSQMPHHHEATIRSQQDCHEEHEGDGPLVEQRCRVDTAAQFDFSVGVKDSKQGVEAWGGGVVVTFLNSGKGGWGWWSMGRGDGVGAEACGVRRC